MYPKEGEVNPLLSTDIHQMYYMYKDIKKKPTKGSFIYILDSSNSSSFTFWTSHAVWFWFLEANELVSQPVTQMAVELMNIHLISEQ